jgi:hypothetical protein
MSISFRMSGFDTVSWQTAQSTGALSYMPYDLAQEYSDIYSMQEMVRDAEKQAARDTIVSVGSFIGSKPGDPNPGAEEAVLIKQHIEVLGGQLFLLDSLIKGLDSEYKKFLAAHPK